MSTRTLFLVFCIFGLLAGASCSPQADFDIRGEWAYTMTDSNNNTYDAGTIVFEGQAAQGSYRETNIYEIEYEGEFSLKRATLKLTGDETWQGTVTDADTMTGTWQHADGANGTFTATRK